MINKREVNKTDMLLTFPELFENELVPGTWYYYTNHVVDAGGVAYFKGWGDDFPNGVETIGVNGSNILVRSIGWFNNNTADSRSAKHYRPATPDEVISAFRDAMKLRGFSEGKLVKYKNKTYYVTEYINVIEDNIYIVARLAGSSSKYKDLPVVLDATICDFHITK